MQSKKNLFSSFFIDLKQTPLFQIEYVNTLIVACCVVICYAYTDILFFVLAKVIVAHLEKIQNRCRELKFESAEILQKDIKEIIKYHIEIVERYKQLNKIFLSTLSLQFLMTAISICMVGFQFRLV